MTKAHLNTWSTVSILKMNFFIAIGCLKLDVSPRNLAVFFMETVSTSAHSDNVKLVQTLKCIQLDLCKKAGFNPKRIKTV